MAYEVPSLQLAEYMEMFTGDIHNYGVHTYNFSAAGKEEGKNSTVTNKLLTVEQYKAHLQGKVGLGVIPVTSDGEAKFGVIDIDVYDTDLTAYLEAIDTHDFPLVAFKSKSGGLHLYLFMRQAVASKSIVDILNKMVALLCLDIYIKRKLNRLIEIFPKQTKIAVGGVGSWINLPYYDVENTRQYAIVRGQKLSFDHALSYIKTKRKTLTEVRAFISDIAHDDGPPCLQSLALLNNISKGGGRNNYLFSFGVYLKKSDPEFWEQKLFSINEAMNEPLGKDELESTIVSSLRKKDYAYKCAEAPCVDYCRKAVCKTREYGIGKEGGYFSELEYGKLIQVKSFEPYYEWEVRILGEEAFKSLRFQNEADIIGQDSFLRLCFRELHVLPVKLKQSEWYKLINQALKELTIIAIEKEDDTSPVGLLRSIFTEFLTERAMAQTKDQILNKRVYHDEKIKCYYFRSQDLSDFVFLVKGFKYFLPGQLHGYLKDFKAEPTRIKSESGKQFRVYTITEANVKALGYITIEMFKADFNNKEEQY
jgi:hypothetical protein